MILQSKKVLINDEFIPANVEVKNGLISKISPYSDVVGAICLDDYLIAPGIIDLHSDALEKEIEPRPNAHFPINFAIRNLDRKISMAGITTMFHAIGFEENPSKHRNARLAREQIESLYTLQNHNELLVDNLIHARFEISSTESLDDLYICINNGFVDILSIMDHTPGQGQFKTAESLANYYKKHSGWNDEQVQALLDKKMRDKDWDLLQKLLVDAKAKNITLLSHDDDCTQKLDMLLDLGIHISEFPLSLEVAKYALQKGSITGMGAPNVVRGGSQSGNVAAIDLIKEGACSYLCSDYHPNSMLLALFEIEKQANIPLAKAFNMITKTPALSIGLNDRGELKEGNKADIIVIKEAEIPEVVWCIKNGSSAYSNLDFYDMKKFA